VPVSIRDASNTESDRNWIQRYYPEYLEDLSQQSMNTGMFPASGEFGEREPELMARWFADDTSHPLVILRNDQPVGFALVSRPMMKRTENTDYRLAEFFVAKPARRLGVGREAAELIFNRFSGRWEITEILRNQPAVAFWRHVVGSYTSGDFREAIQQGEVRHLFKTQLPAAQRRAR